ncbi:ABC transporter ATP-binding protein [Corynebacterium sp. CCUG 70398]|uniref:ABC transporter ATP-binding protein n=1 Tax=Corynebacterium sp. CCUG 70398 TaxID=2823891 RepID=UPI00210E4F2D|nr:ABC transporter ATP-binding protein [Corynebacterium sp. CCUG 70398]MCQ4623072.1 ABC transporter ATP-binding protein [Corynebacterium sp. CCUG 70398]
MSTPFELEAAGLNYSYGDTPVIQDLTMRVPHGQVYGFLGRNGAGKSTVMKILLGLLKPASGQIAFQGRIIDPGAASYLDRVGSLIEEPSFYPNLTGAENIRYISKLRESTAQDTQLLGLVGLSSQAANKKAGEYSLGMKQRLGIALALVGDPELLLLDEPTNGLDPEGIREMRNLIRYFSRELGKTVVVSSHILSEIEQLADTVGIIHQGRMRYEGNLHDLSGTPSLLLDTMDGAATTEVLSLGNIPFTAVTHERFSLPYHGRSQTAQLVSWLVGQGVQIASVSVNERTLEDSFLEITEEDYVEVGSK